MHDNQGFIWLNHLSQAFLDKDYLLPGQTVTERITIIAETAENRLKKPGFAKKFIEYMKKGWFSLSTPIWTNFGTNRGLPISCFNSHMEDSLDSILYAQAEVGMMTKYGGGTSGFFGALRGRGAPIKNNGTSSGSVHFMELFESITNVVSQGSTRRGSFAAYLPIEHPDIHEFLKIRSEGHPIQDLSFGVTVSNKFMHEMIEGNKAYRTTWAKVIESRTNTGYPYIVFIDNANDQAPDTYKDQNKKIKSSNLCTEIFLYSNEEESFVCDLSSMNSLHFDEWKDTDAVEVLTYLLDAVMDEFIEKAWELPFMKRAVQFAVNQRALGIGILGQHSYLQSKMIAFESFEAKMINVDIAKTIYTKALEASAKLAVEYGEPPYLKGYGRRNVTVTAIAPTKSSAFILGQVSEGIEPHRANYYIKDLAKGKFSIKNPELIKLLESKGENTDKNWDQILKNKGSVQSLNCLSEQEKAVFKTFEEISPMEVIIQAGARQNFIDQGQSLNLIIHPRTPAKDINQLYIQAWKLGVKSLYYQISMNAAQELRSILECNSCSA